VQAVGSAALAPLSALTTITKLESHIRNVTDECSALLRLPNLASLTVSSISITTPVTAPGVLQQLTYLEVDRSGRLAIRLPLPKLKDLQIEHIEDKSDGGASLLVLISQQTSLARLVLDTEAPDSEGLSEQQMVQLVAPLMQLQSFNTHFDSDETSCLAACTALAELPLLPLLRHSCGCGVCPSLPTWPCWCAAHSWGSCRWGGTRYQGRMWAWACWLRWCASLACARCTTHMMLRQMMMRRRSWWRLLSGQVWSCCHDHTTVDGALVGAAEQQAGAAGSGCMAGPWHLHWRSSTCAMLHGCNSKQQVWPVLLVQQQLPAPPAVCSGTETAHQPGVWQQRRM
jgi:hypothetical protein